LLSALPGRNVEAAMLRRNGLVGGINVLALKDARFRVGPVLLEGTGPWMHPGPPSRPAIEGFHP
jgi:MOSC domain-containing protein YiiM